MLAFAARRTLSGAVLIASLTFLTFLVFNTIPTNPACLVVPCGPHTTTNDAEIKAADHRLGIDRPVVVQYGKFVWRLVRHGDLGTSWTGSGNVRTQISTALPVTGSLVAGGMILMLLLALTLGCFSAVRPHSLPDRGLLAITVVCLAVHPFVLGIGLRKLFADRLGTPSSGYCTIRSGFGCSGFSAWAAHLAVPWLVFALLFLPLYMRLIRARLLEALNEPWVATARAKGASETRVLLGHVLRNAMGPILPLIAIDAGTALTAAIYIETVFGLPGLGHLAVQAFSGEAGGYDLPLTAGLVTTVGAFVVALNLTADIAGAWLDPRLRLRRTERRSVVAEFASRPRVRLGLVAVAFVAVAVVAYALGRRGSTHERPTVAVRTYGTPQLIDSFDLSGGSGPTTRVRTRVTKLEVGGNGWRVYASITNASEQPLMIFQPAHAPGLPVLYPHQGMSLVVSAALTGRLASRGFTILSARSFAPPLPLPLLPHRTWTGSFAGTETVPRKRKIYVGFGVFPSGLRLLSGTTARAIVLP